MFILENVIIHNFYCLYQILNFLIRAEFSIARGKQQLMFLFSTEEKNLY